MPCLSNPAEFSALMGHRLHLQGGSSWPSQFPLESWHDCPGWQVRIPAGQGGKNMAQSLCGACGPSWGRVCGQGTNTGERLKLLVSILLKSALPLVTFAPSLDSLPYCVFSREHFVPYINRLTMVSLKCFLMRLNTNASIYIYIYFFLWKCVATLLNIQKLKMWKTSSWSMVGFFGLSLLLL